MMTGIHALVSPHFFDALIKHKSVQDAQTSSLKAKQRKNHTMNPRFREDEGDMLSLARNARTGDLKLMVRIFLIIGRLKVHI